MDFSKLLTQIDSVTTKKTYDSEDEGQFYRLSVDKAGNASAVIRFLPDANIDEIPFVRRFKHSFKNPENNRWYIEFSLSTLGQEDYISIVNRELWNSGIEENKEIVRKQKRKLEFISNIYVVKDTANPDAEGKVFKFKYGKKIFDMIVAATKGNPDLGIDPVNPFDPNTGANFMLTQKKVSDWPNFDDSKFGPSTALFGGDQKKIDNLLSQCYNLQEEIAPSKFKSPEELERKFKWVMGIETPRNGGGNSAKTKESQEQEEELKQLEELAKEPVKKAEPAKKSPPKVTEAADEDDDEAFFRSLAAD